MKVYTYSVQHEASFYLVPQVCSLRYKVKGSLMLYTVRVHLHQECILLASANDLANNLMMFLNVSVSDLAGLR